MSALWVKICGITREEDVDAAVAAGADAVGLNRVEGSPRRVTPERARELARHARGRVEVILVVAGLTPEQAEAERRDVGADTLQLHGDEPDEWLLRLPSAYRAVRVRGTEDVERALRLPPGRVLLDAWVPGVLGGTGVRLAEELVLPVARARPVILAGGLEPGNVAGVVARVCPTGVDVASGVEIEGQPGVKSAERVRAFVAAARGARAGRGATPDDGAAPAARGS